MKLAAILLAICLVAGGAAPDRRPTPVVGLAFTTDGQLLFAAHHDRVIVHQSSDGKVQRTLQADLARITSIAQSPDGNMLAIGGGKAGVSGKVVLLDWKQEKVVSTAEGFDDLVTSVVFSPDGQSIAAASADRTVRVVKVDGNVMRMSARMAGHSGAVLATVFSPDGRIVLTASADRSIKVWEAGSGKLLRTLGNHTATVHCLAIRPANGAAFVCASGSEDQTARVWQPEIGRMVRIVRGHGGPVLVLAWSHDGSTLWSAGAEGVMRAIDGESDAVLAQWKGHDDWIYAVAASPKAIVVVSGDWAGTVRAWERDGKGYRRLW